MVTLSFLPCESSYESSCESSYESSCESSYESSCETLCESLWSAKATPSKLIDNPLRLLESELSWVVEKVGKFVTLNNKTSIRKKLDILYSNTIDRFNNLI